MPVAIRINGVGTEWHSLDLDAVARSASISRFCPGRRRRILSVKSAKRLESRSLAMIETAAGVLAAPSIAHEAAALIAGTNDLAADLQLPADVGRTPLQMALQMIVLSARAARIAAFDGVFNRLDRSRRFRRGGKGRAAIGLRRQVPDPSRPDRTLQPRPSGRPTTRSNEHAGSSMPRPAGPSASRTR